MFSKPIRIVAPGALDLRISSALLSSSIAPSGATTTIDFTLKNSGLGSISISATGIYFSIDNILDASDILLSSNDQSVVLNAGEQIAEQNYSLILPVTLLDGNYFILINADNTNLVDEFDEINNTLALAIKIDNTLSSKEATNTSFSFHCYPNPAKDQITIESSGIFYADKNTLQLFNSLGEKVMETIIDSPKIELTITSLIPGIYAYSISGTNQKGKIIIIK
jgi:hypothetical protein